MIKLSTERFFFWGGVGWGEDVLVEASGHGRKPKPDITAIIPYKQTRKQTKKFPPRMFVPLKMGVLIQWTENVHLNAVCCLLWEPPLILLVPAVLQEIAEKDWWWWWWQFVERSYVHAATACSLCFQKRRRKRPRKKTTVVAFFLCYIICINEDSFQVQGHT